MDFDQPLAADDDDIGAGETLRQLVGFLLRIIIVEIQANLLILRRVDDCATGGVFDALCIDAGRRRFYRSGSSQTSPVSVEPAGTCS